MKKLLLSLLLLPVFIGFGQIPAYYSSIDFSLTEIALKNQLSSLIISTHTSPTSYSEIWDVLKNSDLDPTNSSDVLLVYGYNDDDGLVKTDRTRSKHNNGGDPGEWNREHIFPKSLASPNLGTTGAGADPHNLRSSDVAFNNERSSRKFTDNSGHAGVVGTNWYPGDEWAGDISRIVMYMYLRYGTRCRPSSVAVGASNAIDSDMINLLLTWNAEDPVSSFETNRNNVIHSNIGNRNPFIDNPYLAYLIWGGDLVTDSWGVLDIEKETLSSTDIRVYPNPIIEDVFYVSSSSFKEITSIKMHSIQGQEVNFISTSFIANTIQINSSDLPHGTYILTIETDNAIEVKKLIVQ